MSKGNDIFPVRLTPEAKKALQKDAIARGLSMSALVKERLAMGTSFPPLPSHISKMLDDYSQFLGTGHEEVMKRIVMFHFAVIEAGILETGKAPSLFSQASFVKFRNEVTNEYLFDYMTKIARLNIAFNQEAKVRMPASKEKVMALATA